MEVERGLTFSIGVESNLSRRNLIRLHHENVFRSVWAFSSIILKEAQLNLKNDIKLTNDSKRWIN